MAGPKVSLIQTFTIAMHICMEEVSYVAKYVCTHQCDVGYFVVRLLDLGVSSWSIAHGSLPWGYGLDLTYRENWKLNTEGQILGKSIQAQSKMLGHTYFSQPITLLAL